MWVFVLSFFVGVALSLFVYAVIPWIKMQYAIWEIGKLYLENKRLKQELGELDGTTSTRN